MQTLKEFAKRLRTYTDGEQGPCKPLFGKLLDKAKNDGAGTEMDMDKVYYMEHLFLMTMLALKHFFQESKPECLFML